MKQMIYVSFLADGESSTDVLKELKVISKKNNNDSGITGCLVYNNSIFLQAIEGPEREVDLLFTKIKHDKRHSNIKILLEQIVEPENRAFDKWDMKFQLIDKLSFDAMNAILSFSSSQKKSSNEEDIISSVDLHSKFEALKKNLLEAY